MMKLLLPVIVCLLLAASVDAQIITEDQFLTGGANYSVGALSGQNPARTGASGAWTAGADYSISGTGLTFAGLNTDGGSLSVNLATNVTSFLSATESMSNPGTNTVFLSFLMRADNSANTRLGFGANGTRFIGNSTGSFIAGGTTGGTFNSNTTYLLVSKIEWNQSGIDERISLWAYADGASIPASEGAAGAFTVQGFGNIITTGGAWQPGPGFFYQNSSLTTAYNGSLDELRIGASWADVTPVPEPGTMALTVLGLAAALVLHRRRES